MQDHGKEIAEKKAVEEQRRVRNQHTRDVCSMAPINIQMTAMENFGLLFFLFYLLLKCDLVEETLVAHRKCVD